MTVTVTPDEQRFYDLEIRDVSRSGKFRYLEGKAVPYGVWADVNDWLVERHQARSFERSTRGGAGKKLPLLLFHDNRKFPIGHAESWSHTDDGMYGVWQLEDTEDAQQAAALADSGSLTGLSVGFMDAAPPKFDYPRDLDPDGGFDGKVKVTRLESRLVEVSMTPTPAFVDAGVTQVRTRARRPQPPELEVDRWRRIVEKLHSG